MIAAPASGSGKTLLTCGLLKALRNRGMKAASFKCGPDYIDPMFHRTVLGVPARNLDTFFTGEEITRYLFGRAAQKADISILEGVMGFYDGAGGVAAAASSYELAKVTDTPVILVVNARGMSLSVLPLIQGFLQYKQDSHIAGVILNQVSPMTYGMLKDKIEQELSVKVFGYVPKCPELVIESRHLGLVMPEEVTGLQKKLTELSELLEKTLDIDAILDCARSAEALFWEKPESQQNMGQEQTRLRIGIARDEAFCFYYEDNLELLQELGAEPVYFSPLHDGRLPSDLDGLIFYGGYPELYAKDLSANHSMKQDIRISLEQGMPFLAECGGFMYLQESMEDMEGNEYPMAGIFPGKAYRTQKLGRFGYITLTAKNDAQLLTPGTCIKAHEFHYFDCTENGMDYHGKKPFGSREWDCIQGGKHYAAGFPHLYYYSQPGFIYEFLQQCRKRKR